MISLRIDRDKAREMREFFFPYLLEVCDLKTRDAARLKDNDGVMVGRMMLCLMVSVQVKFDRKLLTQQNRFTIKLMDSEAICLYQMLMNMPIDVDLVFECVIRQEVCNFLYDELCLENIKLEE